MKLATGFHRLSTPISKRLSLSSLIRKSGQKRIFPVYHTVSDLRLPHIAPLYPIKNQKAFEADLDTLLKHYRPLSLTEAIAWDGGEAVFHLSFDDGLREIKEFIAPLLLKKGIPATFFINPGLIGNQRLFHRFKAALILDQLRKGQVQAAVLMEIATQIPQAGSSSMAIANFVHGLTFWEEDLLDQIAALCEIDFDDFLKQQQPHLEWEDLKSLQAQGFSFGGHGTYHHELQAMMVEDQLQEASKSSQEVQEKLNLKAAYFAFPFTDHLIPHAFFDRIYAESKHISATFGVAGLKHEVYPQHFHRIDMERNNLAALQILQQEYFYYLAKRLFGKNNIHRN